MHDGIDDLLDFGIMLCSQTAVLKAGCITAVDCTACAEWWMGVLKGVVVGLLSVFEAQLKESHRRVLSWETLICDDVLRRRQRRSMFAGNSCSGNSLPSVRRKGGECWCSVRLRYFVWQQCIKWGTKYSGLNFETVGLIIKNLQVHCRVAKKIL